MKDCSSHLCFLLTCEKESDCAPKKTFSGVGRKLGGSLLQRLTAHAHNYETLSLTETDSGVGCINDREFKSRSRLAIDESPKISPDF